MQDYFLSKLSKHGPVVARKMFGGVGFFMHKVMFACIIDSELYFRVDERTRGDFEALGAKQFTYEGKGKEIQMPYFVLPKEILEDESLLALWMEKAYAAALRNLAKKKKR